MKTVKTLHFDMTNSLIISEQYSFFLFIIWAQFAHSCAHRLFYAPIIIYIERARARISDPLYETITMTAKQSKRTIAKKAPKTLVPVSLEDVQSKIIVLRNEPMILDRDVAMLYGVVTREINQAVKNNPNKFPTGYTYTLNNQEVAEMRSKILTTSSEVAGNEAVNTNFSKSHNILPMG